MSKHISRRKFLGRGMVLGLTSIFPGFFFHLAKAQSPNPPRGRFDEDSTAEAVTAGLDLRGKNILITGANSGLGYETMRVLALRGAHVFATARTGEKAETAARSVKGKVTPLVCELTDYKNIVSVAKTVARTGGHLDGVICNAGIMQLPKLELVNGLEKQFVVNYLGHYLLVMRLLPALKKAPQGRIVMVSSGYYTKAPAKEGIDFENLAGEKYYDPLIAYGQSKLAMALFAREFYRRYPEGTVTANALHPGVIRTNLVRHMPWYMRMGASLLGLTFWKSVEEGAATQSYVATHPSLKKVSGHFFIDCNPIKPEGPHWDNPELAKKLWEYSQSYFSEYID